MIIIFLKLSDFGHIAISHIFYPLLCVFLRLQVLTNALTLNTCKKYQKGTTTTSTTTTTSIILATFSFLTCRAETVRESFFFPPNKKEEQTK
jgi:hypothetical protein